MPANLRLWLVLLVAPLLYSCSFSGKTSSRYLSKARDNTYDIIIVPGIPLENNQWDRIMKARVYWAKYLYDQGITKNIMFSGSAVHTEYFEAKVMALYAEAVGIPKKHIYTELKAEHSVENIYYSYKKAKQLGFNTFAVATDPYQSKMTRSFVRKRLGHDVALIPIVFDTLRTLEPMMIDPAIDLQDAKATNFTALKDRTTFWQRLKGTFGRHLDTTIYD